MGPFYSRQLKLDHALGIDDNDIDKNGYDIVKYICENGINPRKIYIFILIMWFVGMICIIH